MTTHRTETGRSRFAKRGLSQEERMPDDDSASTFSSDGERPLSTREGRPAPNGEAYGSGGSYGYGGAFEHGGQRGYDVTFSQGLAAEQEEPYQATGKFGHDTEGYSREGIGHPGAEEKRPDERPTKSSDGAASGQPASEDARRGFSQESGYVQSGGNPAPGGQAQRKPKKSN